MVIIVFGYGVSVGKYQIFPYQFLDLAMDGFREIRGSSELLWYYRKHQGPPRPAITNTDRSYEGLNLVVRIAAERALSAEIMDMDGNILHNWDLDWFKIWPDAEHLPDWRIPRSIPGTHVHGSVVMGNGDLIYNYNLLGLVRLGMDGKVVWRLPYQTHHSVHRADDGNLWVCGMKEHTKPDARFANRSLPFDEYTILEVSPEGTILQEWSVADILRKNGWAGLLYFGDKVSKGDLAESDVLHMNDVELFPDAMKEGIFGQGDILVSLRDINTVFVFNRHTEKIKFISIAQVVRQHDPDFIDGNTISIFDNNNIAPEEDGPQSQIVIISALDNSSRIFYKGTPENPFYSFVGGKHQWLPNGDLLISESVNGRAFEINRQGEIVWEYINYVDEKTVGLLSEVQRLPLEYKKLFNNFVTD